MQTSTAASPRQPVVSLSVMMFFQFFIWGAWYVPVTGWLNKAGFGDLTAYIYSLCPVAAIISPLFLGMIADRFFASQKVLGVMHLIGGAVMIAIPLVMPHVSPDTPHNLAHPLILMLLVHALCYMPTLGLSSTVAFQHITNQEKVFPIIRVLGTIGWIVAGYAVSFLPGGDQSIYQFWVVGFASIALGLYSFALPHTTPPLAGKKATLGQILGLDALVLLKNRSYLVFVICSFLICIPLAGYYAQARNFAEFGNFSLGATITMTFGQVSEIVFMLVMPLFFIRLGVKKMLLLGMLAWVARYGLFAGAAADQVKWMIFGGILLHGICYDFFFVTGQIYVDKATSHAIRGQAQGFFVLITQGLGMIIGAQLFGKLTEIYQPAAGSTTPDWYHIWLWPCLFALAIAVIFFLFFKEKKQQPQQLPQ